MWYNGTHKPARKVFFKTFLAFNPSIQHNVKSNEKSPGRGNSFSWKPKIPPSSLELRLPTDPFPRSSLILLGPSVICSWVQVTLSTAANEAGEGRGPMVIPASRLSSLCLPAVLTPGVRTFGGELCGAPMELLCDGERSWFTLIPQG